MASSLIGALRVNLGIDTAAFTDGLKAAHGQLKTVGANMQKIGAAVSVVGAGLALAIKGQIDSADELSKAASKFGIPIEALSQLAYAGKLSDVSLDTLGTALGRLSRNMADAAAGSGPAVAAFANLGVSATDAEGNLRPTQDVLFDVADAISRMPDGAAKTAAAMELMGRGGQAMIPLLNGGSTALREMTDEAQAMGLTITEDVGRAAEQFNDNITRLQTTMSGIATQVAANLAPALASITDVIVRLSEGFQNLSPNTQEFLSVGTALAIALGPLLVAAGLLVAAIGAIGLPVVAVVAGIAALTAAVIAFWPEIQALREHLSAWRRDMQERVVQALQSLGAAVVQAKADVIAFGTEALDWIKAKPAEVVAAFQALVAEMKQIGHDVIDGLLSGLKAKWESVKAWFGGLADAIPSWVRGPLGVHSPSTVFAEIGRNLMQGLSQGLDSEQGGIKSEVESFAQDVASTLRGVLTGAMSAREGLSSILGRAGDSLLTSGIDAAFGALQIPGFANGTNFAPGGLAMVGERGPELVHLPRGARVTPNGGFGPGGVVLNFAPSIDARGADPSAVARLEAGQRAMSENFRQMVHAAVADPRARGAI